MTKLNEQIRHDFPILKQKINGQPLVYLDNGATTQKPQAVIDAIEDFYQTKNANVYRSVHTLSAKATQTYENSRELIQQFIGAAYPEEIIFTSGTTASINQIMQGYSISKLTSDSEIIVTPLEHHSNLVPWQMAAKMTGAKLRYVELSDAGEIDLQHFKNILNENTAIVAVSHVSNVLGTIQPIQEICHLAHQVDATVIVDGAQAVAHQKIDVQKLDVDFYVFSGHKIYGPTGIGVLYGKKELLEEMQPVVFGGEMISRVDDLESTWASLPHKLEAGTPNIAGAVGLATAIKYLEVNDFTNLIAAESKVYQYALEELQKIEGLEIYGSVDANKRVSVISFNLDGIHPHDLATALDTQGIAIRAGHHCTQPLMRRLNQVATARVSLGIYNTQAEIDILVRVLKEVKEFFNYGY